MSGLASTGWVPHNGGRIGIPTGVCVKAEPASFEDTQLRAAHEGMSVEWERASFWGGAYGSRGRYPGRPTCLSLWLLMYHLQSLLCLISWAHASMTSEMVRPIESFDAF